MKKVWLLVLALVVINAGVIVVLAAGGAGGDDLTSAVRASAEGEGEEEEEEGGLGPAEPDDYFLFQRSSGGDLPRSSDFTRAVRQARAVRATGALTAGAEATWELEGPTNIGGRLTDLAIDPSDPDTVYVAAATGGVWKSTDGGATVQKAWDDDDAQAIGAIAIGPDGAVWAGTGELNPGGGSITFGGSGIYRSDDGGQTWKRRGLEDSGTTGRIVVDPTDPDTIYVAAGGSLFNPGGERGIYRSTNGGASWRLVLAPETPFTGGADLVMDPTDPDRLYAAMWDHRREPDVRTYGGVGSGLFRTDDGGDTWKRLENVLTKTPAGPSGPADESGLESDETLGRIGVAVAPNDPNRVYVITTHTFGQDKGFYVSNDAGESFNTAARPGLPGRLRLVVRPHLGRPGEPGPPVRGRREPAPVVRRRSRRGATPGGVHADQHGLQWDDEVEPTSCTSATTAASTAPTTNGATRTWTKATHEPYTQHYQVEVAETDPTRVTGGTQDNGCIRSWPGAPTQWNDYGCGDGEYVPIDWSDARIFYGCSQYGACRRYDERSGTLTSTNIQDGTTSIRFNWHAPLVIDPNDPSVIYFGGNQLHRSTDRGDTWSLISPAEQNYLTGTFEPGRNDPIYFRWGTLTTISVSKTAPQTIYVGTDTGRLWKTENLGTTWTEFTGKGLPDRWVTRVGDRPAGRGRRVRDVLGLPQRRGRGARVQDDRRRRDLGEHQRQPPERPGQRRRGRRRARHRARGLRRRGLHAQERQEELEGDRTTACRSRRCSTCACTSRPTRCTPARSGAASGRRASEGTLRRARRRTALGAARRDGARRPSTSPAGRRRSGSSWCRSRRRSPRSSARPTSCRCGGSCSTRSPWSRSRCR